MNQPIGRQILSLYDRLLELDDSPVIALNRAVAVANVHGPKPVSKRSRAIENGSQLKSYYLALCGAGGVRETAEQLSSRDR